MVESLEDKVNIEILKVDNNFIEIIIRGEQKNKNIGIIIDSIINKQLNYEKIYQDIKDCKLEEIEKYLKENDVWIYGTDIEGKCYYNEQKYNGGVAIVIGSEGFGMSRLVKENCDFLVKIPMVGKINSLNASVSAGILMYEVFNQRNNK